MISGPDTALGTDSVRGAKVAFADHKNMIAGHPINFTVEDDGCNAEGGQTAGTKLAANPNIVIVLGPACSSAATPAAPILWKAGITDVGTASSAPSLTAPDRKPDYDGFLRTIPSDLGQGKADATWIYTKLGAKSVVPLHDGSPYAQPACRRDGEELRRAGRQGSADRSRGADGCGHASGADAHRDREARCDLHADLRCRRGAVVAPVEGSARA